MKKLIYSVLGLLLLTLTAKAIPTNDTAKLADPSRAVAAAASVNADGNPPVYKESGIIHRLVFVNDENNHTPISFHDYSTWVGIIGFILLLVMTLLIIVKAETFIANVNLKYRPDKKQPRN